MENQRRNSFGFTLIEVMVVVVILGLLATIVATKVCDLLPEAEKDTAAMEVGELKKTVVLFQTRHRRLPDSLEELIVPDKNGRSYLDDYQEVPVDPWGSPYELLRGGRPEEWEIFSPGPDGRAGTDDDISSRTVKGRRRRR